MWFLIRLFYGRMFWPIIILNAIGWAWCVYEGAQGLGYDLALLWRLFALTL